MTFGSSAQLFSLNRPYDAGDVLAVGVPAVGHPGTIAGDLLAYVDTKPWVIGYRSALTIVYKCASYGQPLNVAVSVVDQNGTLIGSTTALIVQDGAFHSVLTPIAYAGYDIRSVEITARDLSSVGASGVFTLHNVQFGATSFWTSEVLCLES